MSAASNNAAIESGNNASALNAPFRFQEDDVSKGIKITVLFLLLVVSLIGNSLLIAVVFKNANQRMRTPSNYFIFNMAFADILLTVYSVPHTTIVIAYEYRWLIGGVAGEFFCRLSFFISKMCVLVSTGSLFLIALDRYFLVFYPLKRIITLRIARLLIGVVWVFAIAFNVPLFRMTTVTEIQPTYLVCTFDFGILRYIVIYFVFCFAAAIALPITATIIIYIAIGIKLMRTIRPGNQLPSNQGQREQMNRKILTMLVTVVAVLIICRFPWLSGMIVCFTGSKDLCSSLNFLFVGWFLTYVNSVINPWIYFLFNDQFRHGARLLLQRLLPCCFKATNEVDVVQSVGLQMTTHAPQ